MIRFCIIFAVSLLFSTSALANFLDDTSYTNRQLGISLSVPEGWVITKQTGYPSILAFMLSTDGGGKVALSYARLPAGKTLKRYLKETTRTMQATGFDIKSSKPVRDNGAVAWEVRAKDNLSRLRVLQFYLKRGNSLFVFTLTCTSKRLDYLSGELQSFVELTQFQSPRKP
jgi:hypothetical protein